jgi:hypothetical protein
VRNDAACSFGRVVVGTRHFSSGVVCNPRTSRALTAALNGSRLLAAKCEIGRKGAFTRIGHDRAACRCGAGLRLSNFFLSVVCAGSAIAAAGSSAGADYRIRKDYGGFIHQYKLKYAAIRDRGERVIIDGVCNSACTLVLGIVPLNRICVTPRASLGFHTAFIDTRFTAGIKVTSSWATADMLAYYPETVKKWIYRHGGLTADMKTVNGPELWAIVRPCPEGVF